MPSALLFTVRFHDGRYHGAGDWPPSPARLFQALVAGASDGEAIAVDVRNALCWLERLDPPEICTPPARYGQGYRNFVPNNDLDAMGGMPWRINKIRAPKPIRPRLFDARTPLFYCWRYDDQTDRHARTIIAVAKQLYQLGRGVDMAWASAEILDEAEADKRLESHGGAIHRPAPGSGGLLACPAQGSLHSLIVRHKAMGECFEIRKVGRTVSQLFSQPPKPRFRQVAYDSPPRRLLFELRETATEGNFHPWPLNQAARLVETLRNGAADKLAHALPKERAGDIERVFIGRNATEADKAQRIRITPLPSIGHQYAESSIRRVLVEVPPDCPLDARAVAWAFSAWAPYDPETGEIPWQLVEIDDDAGERYTNMLGHYGIGGGMFRLWRTVTPAALPEDAARRRIDPGRIRQEAKGATERLAEETRAVTAVCNALRHEGIETPVEAIRVHREPFHARGARAEAFAPGIRFSKHRLWHVEIAFAIPRAGPLIIGDGRYLGLGLMAPERQAFRSAAVFSIKHKSIPAHARTEFLAAVRRALMALDRDHGENDRVSTLFSGHKPDGSPAGEGGHHHVFLAADTDNRGERLARVCVFRPDAVDRNARLSTADKARFDRVVSALREVRAGQFGVTAIGFPHTLTSGDPLFGLGCTWESRTPYRPTRHAGRGKDPSSAILQDAVRECERRGLPRPKADLLELTFGPNGGNLAARVRLRFAVAVAGPIMLGRDSHKGGGLFAVVS